MMNYIMPIIACNALFYGITSISTSITSTQNIFRFIVDHKDSDYIVWQYQLETTDLYNKLQITSALLKDIIKKHCVVNDKNKDNPTSENEEIEKLIDELTNPKFDVVKEKEKEKENNDYSMVELVRKTSIEITIPEPVKISLLSLLDVINKINNVLEKIYIKIAEHQKIYFKNMFKINIHNEINKVLFLTNLFNSRLMLLFELLKIYKDKVIN